MRCRLRLGMQSPVTAGSASGEPFPKLKAGQYSTGLCSCIYMYIHECIFYLLIDKTLKTVVEFGTGNLNRSMQSVLLTGAGIGLSILQRCRLPAAYDRQGVAEQSPWKTICQLGSRRSHGLPTKVLLLAG